MTLLFRMNWSLIRAAKEDLRRRHTFAHERIGFLCCRAGETNDGIIVLAESYHPVADQNYVKDNSVGARINGAAFRAAFQLSLSNHTGLFHVHMHAHKGMPRPSRTDMLESKKFVPDFFHVTPAMPHGLIILSEDSCFGLYWLGRNPEPKAIDRIEFVGSPLKIVDVRA